jgi:hypothetical protein
VGNTEGNRPLGRPNCRWEDNNNIDVTEVGWDGVDSETQIAASCEDDNEASFSIKYGVL